MIIADFGHMRMIMVHVPKAAGSALRLTLRKHIDLSITWRSYTTIEKGIDTTHNCLYYEEVLPHLISNSGVPIKIITSIRNPYDRIYSAFLFNQRTQHYKKNRMHNNERVKIFITNSFLDFVKYILPDWVKNYREQAEGYNILEPIGIHFAPMTLFLTDISGNIRCDYFVRQELFNSDIQNICKFLKLDIVSPRVFHCANGAEPPRPFSNLKHYDSESVKIINELYDDEFLYFGYKKISPTNFNIKSLNIKKLSDSC